MMNSATGKFNQYKSHFQPKQSSNHDLSQRKLHRFYILIEAQALNKRSLTFAIFRRHSLLLWRTFFLHKTQWFVWPCFFKNFKSSSYISPICPVANRKFNRNDFNACFFHSKRWGINVLSTFIHRLPVAVTSPMQWQGKMKKNVNNSLSQ